MFAVYVQTNGDGANHVIAFRRAADGILGESATYPTRGVGDGRAHLTSQGSVVLTADGRHLLVCNAGSGDVSVFVLGQDELRLVATTPTGGAPKSVAVHDGLVYVLNTAPPSLAGFRLGDAGLEPLPGSTRELAPAGADPAQVGFAPDGRALVVTERGSNAISRYAVGGDGSLAAPTRVPSSGPTPYGFAFTPNGTLFVTEAFGAERGKAAASSYLTVGGELAPVSRSIGNGRSEICWAVVTPDGRYAFATNFADGAVSRYAIGRDGALTLEDAAAGTAIEGSTGLRDAGLSRDGAFLYALDADARRIFGWRVGDDGALRSLGSWDGLPATAAGLAAS